MDISSQIGEFAALLVAIFWTITALSFESASKIVGSLSVNMIRLFFAFIILAIFSYFYRGMILPLDADLHAWIWLSLSGLIGFVFGDYFLFSSFAIIGSRISMLIMTLVPPITALIGWLLLGETMSSKHIFGMTLTVSGIAIAILNRPSLNNKMKFNYSVKGVVFAFLGAVGQAVGLVLSKYGMKSYDPFAATHIRIIVGMVGFAIIVVLLRKTSLIRSALKSRKGMTGISIGSVFGPFLGVSLSLYAIQHTGTGIASTIMAIVPILIIPPAIMLFKQKVSMKEVVGAVISVIGVALFFV